MISSLGLNHGQRQKWDKHRRIVYRKRWTLSHSEPSWPGDETIYTQVKWRRKILTEVAVLIWVWPLGEIEELLYIMQGISPHVDSVKSYIVLGNNSALWVREIPKYFLTPVKILNFIWRWLSVAHIQTDINSRRNNIRNMFPLLAQQPVRELLL